MGLLSWLLFLPVVGAVIIALLDAEKFERQIKSFAIGTTAVVLALSIRLWTDFTSFGVKDVIVEWIPQINVTYHLGVDGFSVPLIFLTALLSVLVMVWAWDEKNRYKEMLIYFLILETGMLGVFLSLDLFLFFIFWEVSLVPMYFLIGIWGGPRREYASIKFFLYTLAGSVALLLGIFVLYFSSTPHTLDIPTLIAANPLAGNLPLAAVVFWLVFIGFAIKVPVFPFHTWLPDAHVEAPTAGSVILAGVLLKMGGYGFIRILLPILPEASRQFGWVVALLAVISIVYGGLVALAQTDFKKLVAYSSVSHMGYVMLGVSSVMLVSGKALETAAVTALNGAVLQMFNHGIITGALFFLVGMIYNRTHNRDLNKFGGLDGKVPKYAAVLTVTAFAALGLPGLNGFVGEFLIFLGSYSVLQVFWPYFVPIGLLGIIIGAAYMLWTLQRILLGKPKVEYPKLTDITRREMFIIVTLIAIMLWVGLYPAPVIDVINGASQTVVAMFV